MSSKFRKLTSIERADISLNIDGLPLFKSSRTNVWPILGLLHIAPFHPFVIRLTCGVSKPTDLEFLNDLIVELSEVLQEGIQLGNKRIQISLRCIVADAPARALIKAMTQFNGYFGCDFCEVHGVWHGKVTFLKTSTLRLRTDAAFRSQSQPGHHNGQTPLITGFPLCYMHQYCLGVQKRLLLTWLRGPLNVRLSHV